MAKRILKSKKMPKELYVEVVGCAVICPTIVPQRMYKERSHNKLGVERSLQFSTYVCLGALHMCMYQNKKGPS
jgi:hypothetical protein